MKNAKIVNVNQEGRVCIYRGRVIYLAGRTAEPHDRGAERERGGGVRMEQKVHDNAEHSNANENRRRNYRPGCVQLVPVTHKQQIGMGNRVSSHSIRAINKREGTYQLAALHYTVSIRHRRKTTIVVDDGVTSLVPRSAVFPSFSNNIFLFNEAIYPKLQHFFDHAAIHER